jgi:hypothetical protein
MKMYKAVILYGNEVWIFTAKVEYRLKIVETRLLRRIFGPKRDEIVGGWRKFHTEELHNMIFQT